MPDSGGKLTPEEKQKIIGWLNEKGKNHACPVCQENSWTLGEYLLGGMTYQGGSLVLGGVHYPQFFLTCSNCFFTRQFMATPVLKMEDPQLKEEKKKKGKKAAGGANG